MDQSKPVAEDFGTTPCSTVIELEIRPRIEHCDHCGVFTVSGGYVGFVSLVGKHVKVQRCGSCRIENYAPAVIEGVCCWCGWNANDPLQATIARDHR